MALICTTPEYATSEASQKPCNCTPFRPYQIDVLLQGSGRVRFRRLTLKNENHVIFLGSHLDNVSQDAMSESQEELLGAVTVAPTPERGVVTVAGTTAVASEGEGSGEEGCTGGHSSRELPRH